MTITRPHTPPIGWSHSPPCLPLTRTLLCALAGSSHIIGSIGGCHTASPTLSEFPFFLFFPPPSVGSHSFFFFFFLGSWVACLAPQKKPSILQLTPHRSHAMSPCRYFSNREFSFTLKDGTVLQSLPPQLRRFDRCFDRPTPCSCALFSRYGGVLTLVRAVVYIPIDVYIRYRSFASEEEMTADIKKMNPYKIDIGAVFSAKVRVTAVHDFSALSPNRLLPRRWWCVGRASAGRPPPATNSSVHTRTQPQPKDHKKIKASEFRPLEKELVFDIDMTDYDDIRPCCSGAAICKRCWPFMNCAIKVCSFTRAPLLRPCRTFNQTRAQDQAPHRRHLLDGSARYPRPRLTPPLRCSRSSTQRSGKILGSSSCSGCTLAVVVFTAGCVTNGHVP